MKKRLFGTAMALVVTAGLSVPATAGWAGWLPAAPREGVPRTASPAPEAGERLRQRFTDCLEALRTHARECTEGAEDRGECTWPFEPRSERGGRPAR